MIAWPVASQSGLCLVALSLLALPAGAEVIVPPGFEVHAYVSGDGFEAGVGSSVRGIPSTSTLAFDEAGALYLGRTGRRYTGGEVEDLWPLYRIPLGGARLTPAMEAQYFYGPPLLNAQVAAMRAGARALHHHLRSRPEGRGRVSDARRAGRAVRRGYATGRRTATPRPARGRGGGCAAGRVLDPRYVSVARPRLMAAGESGHLWIGSDGTAEAPWQRGIGEIVKVVNRGAWRVNEVLRISGPLDAPLRGR